jgi:type II secretory pathway component HofQ
MLKALALVALLAGPERRITLEVQKADVHAVLRMFGELMHANLVVGDEVHGAVTLSLRNVKVSEAFAVVLQSQGLGYEQAGDNLYRVAPLKQLADEAEARAKLKDAKHKAAPLVTRLIPVSYASAADLVAQVKPLLSDRGTVTFDARTNTLIVRDAQE